MAYCRTIDTRIEQFSPFWTGGKMPPSPRVFAKYLKNGLTHLQWRNGGTKNSLSWPRQGKKFVKIDQKQGIDFGTGWIKPRRHISAKYEPNLTLIIII